MVISNPHLDSEILRHLRQSDLLRHGHFAFRSGRHSAALLDRDRLLADPAIASRMGYTLAKAFFTEHIDTIATPSIWGAGLAQFVGYFLDPKAKVVYATPKPDGTRSIAANLHDLIADRRLLLVDNLIISGETMEQFSQTIEAHGGTVIGIGTLWDAADEVIDGHEVLGLLNDLYPAYPPDDCPLCAAGELSVERVSY
jgi:orotate phosphoribosyltransferase